jgi:ribosomal peptide maturation radical SAM protein 1
VETERPELLEELDWLPVPDHRDYFDQIEGLTIEPVIHFETSRGCWWGDKHLCTFCGLNANGLSFRRKSPQRVVEEIEALVTRYPSRMLLAADNILDMSYFKTVLPALKQRNASRHEAARAYLFYETKSNLKKDQIELAKDAGLVAVQPGIESFNDHVLDLMQKGTTGIQQVQFVKWATEIGISLRYGILFGTVGETAHDYDEMLDVVPFISHLIPPKYIVPLSIDRFSPYFTEPERYQLTNLRPHGIYRIIFQDPELNLDKLAYKFVADHADDHNEALRRARERCAKALIAWRDSFEPDRLVYEIASDTVRLLDRRGRTPTLTTLRGAQAEMFLRCDGQCRWDHIVTEFRALGPERVTAFLEQGRARRWLYRDQCGRCIVTPVRRDLRRWLRDDAVVASRRAVAGELAASFF